MTLMDDINELLSSVGINTNTEETPQVTLTNVPSTPRDNEEALPVQEFSEDDLMNLLSGNPSSNGIEDPEHYEEIEEEGEEEHFVSISHPTDPTTTVYVPEDAVDEVMSIIGTTNTVSSGIQDTPQVELGTREIHLDDHEANPHLEDAVSNLIEHLQQSGVNVLTGDNASVTMMENGQTFISADGADIGTDISSIIQHDEEALIPENSPTLLVDESTSRFSGTEWYEEVKNQKVIIAGLGGIGSHTAMQIARLTPKTLVLYDDDIIETGNMSGQLYGHSDVGKYKVDVLARRIRQYTQTSSVYANTQRFTSESIPGSIMICGFDNMAARKIFYQSWLRHVENDLTDQRSKHLFIDGRLSIDTVQVFCITGDDKRNMEKYSKRYLFDDSEADETICSLKQTTYLASMIGSIITNLFVNFVANTLDPVIPYSLPFFTEYDANFMLLKSET